MRVLVAALWLVFAPSALAVEAGGALPALQLAPLEGANAVPPPFASLRGKVVYVDFWASWCAPCRLSMPALQALYEKHRAQGFVVVGVNKDVSAADARRFLAKVPVTFPLASDAGDAVARALDVKAMPSGYVVDRKGIVRYVHRGFTQETAARLGEEIDALVKEAS